MPSEITKAAPVGTMEVREQVNQIQYLMQDVLKEGEHYGTVPGCGSKPTLLQPGAEKIAYMFHLVPTYEVRSIDLGGGHREYDITCTLAHRDSGQVAGCGMGLCSTMESKYRYRSRWDNGKKVREENADIADVLNTVLKMAKKRAFVDAVKSTTAASDIFSQDIEDIRPVEQPQPKPSPLDAYRAALTIAKRERGVGIQEAMDEVARRLGKPPESFDEADVAAAVLIVEGLGRDEDAYEAALEPQDIEF